VKLATYWIFSVAIKIVIYSALHLRCNGIRLWTNQYLIRQQLFSYMASLGAGKTGVNEQCFIFTSIICLPGVLDNFTFYFDLALSQNGLKLVASWCEIC
jgi:hypothetical protein